MIRPYVFVMIALLAVAGCQGPGSIAGAGKFVKTDEQTATRAKVAHANVFVMFAEIKVGAVTKYCPVAAVTVDDECDAFSRKRLDVVCRWAGNAPGKAGALRGVQWKSVVDEGQPQQKFSIEFEGGTSPCVDPLSAGPVVTCAGKDAAALGLPDRRSNKEVEFEYIVKASPSGGCPILDPYIIWRR